MIEQLFKPRWIEKRPLFAFIIGFIYSFISFISAIIIFPKDLGMASIAFLSILLLPSLNKLISIEEKQELSNRKPSIKAIMKEHYDIIEVYLFLFLSIMLSYFFLFLITNNSEMFYSQLNAAGIMGNAINKGLLTRVLINNLKILIVFFILSIIYGAGSIFFLVWNASAWGVVFAYIVLNKGSVSPFIASLPHLIFEALGYLIVVIAGAILSKIAIHQEKIRKTEIVINDALLMLLIGIAFIVLGAIIESI